MNKKSKVILLPCNSYREELVYENLETGLELLGRFESIVGKEESILLKPNLLKKAEVDKAVITHPVIVGACLHESDAGEGVSGYYTGRFLRQWNNNKSHSWNRNGYLS